MRSSPGTPAAVISAPAGRVHDPRQRRARHRERPAPGAVARKVQRAHRRVGDVLGRAEQRDALVGAVEVDDLDAVLVVPALQQAGRQRRRAGAEHAQRGDVGLRQQRLIVQQAGEQRGRGHRVGGAVLLDLPQERGQVERVMLHEQAAHLQPRQEHAVDAGHVHHRERVEQHVVGGQAGAFHRARAHGHPVVVGPLDTLGRALRSRGPADGDAVVRVGGEVGQVGGQPAAVIGRRDALVEPEHSVRHVRAGRAPERAPERGYRPQRRDLPAQPGDLAGRPAAGRSGWP